MQPVEDPSSGLGTSGAVLADDDLAARVRSVLADGWDVDLQTMVDLVAGVTGAPIVSIAVLRAGVYHYDVCAGAEPFGNPAEKALCQFATGSPDVFEVPDTLADERTRGLASVDGRENAVRYYLSVPLVVGDREVGRFCVFDLRPRRLGRREHEMLQVLATAAGKILDLRLLQSELAAAEHPVAAVPSPRNPGDLVARAAHDLRSPLVTLEASLELLGDALGPRAGSVPLMLIGKAESAVVRMNELVAGVLALQSLDHGDDVSDVDLDQVLDAVREDLGNQLSSTGGQVLGHDLGPAHGNRAQLYSVLLNLVANALKFGRPGVPPRVTVATEHTDEGVLLTVTDEGVGIPVEERENVFDLFTRLGPRSGHGIGLSTVALIVEVHGGRVSVADRPVGHGTRIEVWLPHA